MKQEGPQYTESQLKQQEYFKWGIIMFNFGRWGKSLEAFIYMAWDFALFIFLVISLSITENGNQCGKTTLTAISVTVGFRFTGFAFHGTKFFLAVFKQITPNQFSLLDAILYQGEFFWTIFLIYVVAVDTSSCMSEELILGICLVLSLINGIIKIIQCLLQTGCCVALFVGLLSKIMPFEKCGDSIGFMHQFFEKDHKPVPEEDEENNRPEEAKNSEGHINPDNPDQVKEE